MNKKIRLLAMMVALSLTATACGAPASTAPSASAPNTSSEAASQAASIPAASSEAATPSADPATPADKPATSFALSIPMGYDLAEAFSDGLAMVGVGSKENMQYSYIDTTGKKVLDLEPGTNGTSFANGIAQVFKRDEAGMSLTNFIDKTGKLLLEQWLADDRGFGGGGGDVTRAIGFSISKARGLPDYWCGSEVYKAGVDGTSALFDSNVKIVIPFGTYSYLNWVPDTDYVITTQNAGGTWSAGVIKLDGSVVLEAKYSNIGPIGTIGFAVKESNDAPTKLMLHDGTLVEPQGYKANRIWYNSDTAKIYFNVLEADGSAKSGIMDKTGKVEGAMSTENLDPPMFWGMALTKDIVTPDGMETIYTDSTHQIVATGKQVNENYELTPNVKVGIADLAGNLIVKPTYEGISLPYGGVFVTSNGYEVIGPYNTPTAISYTLVSADEKVKSDPYKAFGYMGEGMIAVSDGAKWGYVKVGY